MKVYKLQEIELRGLLNRLNDFEKSGLGKVYNIGIMTNVDFSNQVFVEYEMSNAVSENPVSESYLWKIGPDGKIINFKEFFSNPFDLYAFLGRCLVQNIENVEIIDI